MALLAAIIATPIALTAGPSFAKDTGAKDTSIDPASPVGKMLSKLEAEGYKITDTANTMLGRTKIEASKDIQQREIVMNPETGEILRDRVQQDSDFDNDTDGAGSDD
ncbi:MAG: PepSY domain-containing protein [Salaquimonas sp.]|jgi:hypothetical protein|nr:PepSY domain-containing protein [Salaquimonas sp.]